MKFRRVLLCVLVFALFLLLFLPFQKNIFSVQFGDEDDNFVIGQWLLQGKRLYQDIFYNHQPVPILASSTLQKIYHPVSIFSLVKYHRVVIFVGSALCSLGLVYLLGYPALIFTTIFEFTKFFLLGNLFLAEALVVYPIIFIITIIHKLLNKNLLTFWEIILSSLSLILIQLTLLPITPFVIWSFFLIIKELKKKQKSFFLKSFAILIFISITFSFPFLSFIGYFKDTFLVNLSYVLPYEAQYSFWEGIKKVLLLPFIVLFLPNQKFFLILKLVSVLYIFSFLTLVVKKRNYRIPLILFTLLIATNCRPVRIGVFRNGFHLLPFYSAFLLITLLQVQKVFSLSKSYLLKTIVFFLMGILIFVSSWLGSQELFRKNDPFTNWNTNYADFAIYGETIKFLANQNDTLLTLPAASLIYWQSNLFPNSRFFFLLGFMKESKILKEEFHKNLKENPPAFLYLEEGQNIDKLFPDFVTNYQQINKDDKLSLLFIHKNKLPKISDSQWQKVKPYGFEKPNAF